MTTQLAPMPVHFAAPTHEAAAFVAWLRTHPSALWVAWLLPAVTNLGYLLGGVGVLDDVSLVVVMGGLYRLVGFSTVGFVSFVVSGYLFLRLAPTGWRVAAVGLPLAVAAASVSAGVAYANARADMVVATGPGSAFAFDTFGQTLSMALVNLSFLRHGQVREDAARRLAAAKQAQREARRRLAQSDLQAVQARIDPQLLFDMLDAVRQAYETEPERAELLLDQLVAFLRAALPRLAHASSSVPREAEIVRAFMRLHQLARPGGARAGPGLRIEVDADLMDARFPPGVLLPIVGDALRARSGDCGLQASRQGETSRVVLTLPAGPAPATLTCVRGLLDHLYGPAAELRSEPAVLDAHRSVRITLKVPHERA